MTAGVVTKPLKDGAGLPFVGQFYDDGSGNLTPAQHVIDGANETQGGRADAAATDPTSSWSMIALLKGAWSKLEAQRTLLAGTLTTKGLPFTSAVMIAPGTPVTAGRAVFINCTQAGTVRLKFSGGSTLDVPVNVGASELTGYAVVDVVAAYTTAICAVSVLS